jgi:hypothetical protein
VDKNSKEVFMDKKYERLSEQLNNRSIDVRFESLRKLKDMADRNEIQIQHKEKFINNHIHTKYSFSPYYPAKAVWMAYKAGLATAGIMDHDSISGAREFIKAGEIAGIATTIGVECRASFHNTPLEGRRLNNPDQNSIAYIALHGIPHTKIDKINEYFKPYREERNKRNKLMTLRINDITKPFGIYLDYDNDIVPISLSSEGGSITERHILFALSKKLVKKYGKGKEIVDFLENKLLIDIKPKIKEYLIDTKNEFYEYDVLGALKSDMVEKFYINAKKECPDVRDILRLADNTGAIAAYAYLGDVGESVTGDKKTQKFEDDYIELLFQAIKDLGFNAVTYMPSRNSIEQLKKVMSLCEKHNLFQISGEDINSPRQHFICESLAKKEFSHLFDSTWALIGHERAATKNINLGMFSEETIGKYPDLGTRIRVSRGRGY